MRPVVRAGIVLAVIAAVSALVAELTFGLTAGAIAVNRAAREQAFFERVVPELAGVEWRDSVQTRRLQNGAMLKRIGLGDGRVVRVFVPWPAEPGYNGVIDLLVAVNASGCIEGVDVLHHRETPGLGDRIEPRHSTWLRQFVGRCYRVDEQMGWLTRRDGGTVHALTGATVTSRAVLKGLQEALAVLHRVREEF